MNVLMLIKGPALAARCDKGMYWIGSKELKGFQCGTPGYRERTYDELFSSEANLELIVNAASQESTASYTQADINRILQTLHPAESLASAHLKQ